MAILCSAKAAKRSGLTQALGLMRCFSIAIALFLAGCTASPDASLLLSVYDGWGTHQVPGYGTVAAPSGAATIQCGQRLVKVEAVEISEEGGQPSADRIRELRAHNERLLYSLRTAGNACPLPASKAEA